MPWFKITTTTTSFINIDPTSADDLEAFEDAIDTETGKVDTDALTELLENDISDPHENLDVTRDSQLNEIVQLTPEQEKDFKEAQ